MSGTRGFASSSFGMLLAGGFLLAAVAPAALSAQEVDSRWLPWLGCWEAVEGADEAPMLCVRPLASGEGVEFITWAEGKVISSEIIRADGLAREATREDCQGLEEARFSEDGHRVFLNSRYRCDDGSEQSGSGILAVVNPMEWVDIKVVGSAGDRVPWALRYRLARAAKVAEVGMEGLMSPRALAVKSARISASAPLAIEDVIDALDSVDPEGVETLIVERGDPFQVDARTLLALADAGVSERVIDLVVAVSYPDRFSLRPGGVKELPRERTSTAYPGAYGRSLGWSPWYYDPFYMGYGMYSPYYGYNGYGGYGGMGWSSGYYYRPTTFVIEPREPATGSSGRAVKGQGYTRGGSSSGGSSGTVTRGSPTSGSSGGSASSGGSVSGGGSSTGRTAVRRGGGGGV